MRFRDLAASLLGLFSLVSAGGLAVQTGGSSAPLPLKPDSVKFAFMGDFGNGSKSQYQTASEMTKFHQTFGFGFVLLLGDNIYGRKTPQAFQSRFEQPYEKLMDAGVKFYASLGNHDVTAETYYQPFNMEGHRYYSFKKGNAEFFALDSTYFDPVQTSWLEKQLAQSGAHWKICYFHHPLYSHAKKHGSDVDLRRNLEPLLQKYAVDVVLNGHDHVYERLKPKGGIYYFVLGNAGELRVHDLRPSEETLKGFDTDTCFGLMEIAGDDLYFQIVSRTGATVDSGVFTKTALRKKP